MSHETERGSARTTDKGIDTDNYSATTADKTDQPDALEKHLVSSQNEPESEGPATICWICQQPIDASPRRYRDEPVHEDCYPDTPEEGLVCDGGTRVVDGEDRPLRRYRCYQCGREFKSAAHLEEITAPCGHGVVAWRARIAFFAQNTTIQALADGPQPLSDFHLDGPVRELVHRLKPAGGGGAGNSKPRDGGNTVRSIAYLPGDERAAVREFIRENPAYVADCLGDRSNPLAKNWSEEMYQLLVEQYEWLALEDDEDAPEVVPDGGHVVAADIPATQEVVLRDHAIERITDLDEGNGAPLHQVVADLCEVAEHLADVGETIHDLCRADACERLSDTRVRWHGEGGGD